MNPVTVWEEFVHKLRNDTLSEVDCRPIEGQYHGLYVLRPEFEEAKKSLFDMPTPPWEWGEDRLIFNVVNPPAITRNTRFDFIVDDERWRIYWVEQMTLPIKKVAPLPFDDFPALDTIAEGFALADVYYTQKALMFVRLKKSEGIDAALSFFEDNVGSNSGAWLPYFREPKALVVALCWVETRLNHERVSIESFSDTECIVRYHGHVWFRHYKASTHMRTIISEDDHRRLFEHVWRHRASQGRWTTRFEYEGEDTSVILTK